MNNEDVPEKCEKPICIKVFQNIVTSFTIAVTVVAMIVGVVTVLAVKLVSFV